MKRLLPILCLLSLFAFTLNLCAEDGDEPADDGWITLFDGESLEGWKISENKDSFSLKEGGILVVNGPRGHMFYDGEVENHDFTNFHFKAEVMTMPAANSGLYFHTQFQETGWPSLGYEVQVNQTHGDPKKSSGLYGVKDIFEAPAEDEEWYTQEIIVRGNRIITRVNGKTLVDYVQPDDIEGGRKLSSGTFAIQAHDPGSTVFFKNIQVKPLDE